MTDYILHIESLIGLFWNNGSEWNCSTWRLTISVVLLFRTADKVIYTDRTLPQRMTDSAMYLLPGRLPKCRFEYIREKL